MRQGGREGGTEGGRRERFQNEHIEPYQIGVLHAHVFAGSTNQSSYSYPKYPHTAHTHKEWSQYIH